MHVRDTSTNSAKAVDQEDDWTGVTNEADRRKIQNRLNVRAYRRRKAEKARQLSTANGSATSPMDLVETQPIVPHWDEHQREVVFLSTAAAGQPLRKENPLLSAAQLSHHASPIETVIFPLSSDNLIVLLQYNVLRASIANHQMVSSFLGVNLMAECADGKLHVVSGQLLSQTIPPSLQPTALQRAVPHQAWIDVVPHPRWRDNLLQALGGFDDDALWSDIIGGLFEGFPDAEVRHRGIIAWSPSWDVSGWEISEGFLNRWGWTLRGCEDVLNATNRWRARREEPPLVLELDS
ncbi:hypothetical protein GQ53DRAFT_640359 [Thozetella sp. PMI_491]|nr:hypothetical protein GQ53DRAFT_640359 [Thozetella sp. PMI_491]